MEKEQILARMFFVNGHIETRPLEWIEFATPEQVANGKVFDKQTDLEGDDEVYVAMTTQLTGIQLYRGVFTNVRAERRQRTDGR